MQLICFQNTMSKDYAALNKQLAAVALAVRDSIGDKVLEFKAEEKIFQFKRAIERAGIPRTQKKEFRDYAEKLFKDIHP